MKYLEYMIKAVVNGYTIKVYEIKPMAQISLVYEKPREIHTAKAKQKYLFSNKTFEYMFSVKITGKFMKPYWYVFHMGKEFRKAIQDQLNSDAVYQLIKS